MKKYSLFDLLYQRCKSKSIKFFNSHFYLLIKIGLMMNVRNLLSAKKNEVVKNPVNPV